MPLHILPKVMTSALPALTEEFLKQQGIQLLMLDFDNTIVPYTTDIPTAEVELWLQRMMASDIRICVVSNSRKDRVKQFCRQRGITCITKAKKPFPKGIRQCMRHFDVQPEVCALVGDQMFTDVLGANCAGVQSILVKPIHNHNIWLKARHVLEKPLIWLAKGRKIG